MPLTREQIAQRIAQEIEPGFVVNLGIGIPSLVANYVGPEMGVMFQSENGLLGLGPFPFEEEVDPDLINAGKQTVTALPGASFFSSADSFAMIRGGHVNLTILGAMEVDQEGSIANWMVPGKMVKGMGGAMDLVAGAKKVIVAMQAADRQGQSKLRTKCTLPLTGVNCVHSIVSDWGVFEIKGSAFILKEYSPDLSPEWIQKNTEGKVILDPTCRPMNLNGN
jgi:3-oxoacid CoA-transferase subunit B